MNNKAPPLSFQELWEEAEKISVKRFEKLTDDAILHQLTDEITHFNDFDSTKELSGNTKNMLRAKNMGTIVFILTAISMRHNINVWKSLYDTIEFEKLDFGKLSEMVKNGDLSGIIPSISELEKT